MLQFDIDAGEIRAIAREFGASNKQLKFAYSRALRRTATTMRSRARKGLKDRLGLRNAKEIRKRLYGFRFMRGKGDLGGVRMWFGLNDLRVSSFKGRVRETASGAAFARGEIEDGFVARNRKGQRTIMKRVGRERYPIHEARAGIEDEAQTFIEDEVFDDVEEVFYKNFRAEIRARTIYDVGA